MNLNKLLTGLKIKKLSGNINIPIEKITSNSKNVGNGDLFVAIKGANTDGHVYIQEAISKGAVAIIYQKDSPINYKTNNVVFVKLNNTRKALAVLASNYFNNIHKKMRLVGVTGTNGKTTTCELAYQLLNALNKKVGLISTVSAKFSHNKLDTGYHVTTPDSLALHKILYEMYKSGCEYVIIETTSHALDQYRTYGLHFDIGAVTNVTPEHLDYHKTFDNYLKAKAKIFKQSKIILLNKYDPSLQKLLKFIPKYKQYKIVDYRKTTFTKEFTEKFPGTYNLENGSMAKEIVYTLTDTDTTKYFSRLKSVEGRMEVIDTDKDFKVIIDFAHDHISLEKVLQTARHLTNKNLIVVFGCAGLRDKLKRPKMGKIAIKLADKVVITAEDPRTEKLEDIIQQIEFGVSESGGVKNQNYFIVEDRQAAIGFAINKLAKPGDLVLITGKGHEKSMCFGTEEIPWSDRKAVIRTLKK